MNLDNLFAIVKLICINLVFQNTVIKSHAYYDAKMTEKRQFIRQKIGK